MRLRSRYGSGLKITRTLAVAANARSEPPRKAAPAASMGGPGGHIYVGFAGAPFTPTLAVAANAQRKPPDQTN